MPVPPAIITILRPPPKGYCTCTSRAGPHVRGDVDVVGDRKGYYRKGHYRKGETERESAP